MIDKGDIATDEERFTLHETEYIARIYKHEGHSCGEICYAQSNKRPYRKMRGIAWEYLRSMGLNIDGTVTDRSVEILVKELKKVKQTIDSQRFELDGDEYVANLYEHEEKPNKHGEILYASAREAIPEMTSVAMKKFKQIPPEEETDLEYMSFYELVKRLIDATRKSQAAKV